MQKNDVKYLRTNIWPLQVYLSLGIIHFFFQKFFKIQKKSCQIFSKKKFLIGNSYAEITKKYFFWKFSKKKKVMIFYGNWPKTNLLTRAHQKGLYCSETIFCRVFWDMSLLTCPNSLNVRASTDIKRGQNFQLEPNQNPIRTWVEPDKSRCTSRSSPKKIHFI